MSCVYIHTNKVNGKKYVGKSNIDPKVRWGNGHGYKCSKKFYNAIKKYGWNAFTHEVVLDGLTKEQASEFEKMLIAANDSIHNGYNVAEGGQGGNGIFGGMKAAEILRRPVCQYDIFGNFVAEYEGVNAAAKFLYGKKRDSGICQVCNGIGGTAHGYVWRYKGDAFNKYDVNEKKQTTSVIQVNLNGDVIARYDKIADASAVTGIGHGDIIRCCKGMRKHAGGYVWKYGEAGQ